MGVPGPYGQNTYRLVDLTGLSSLETWDLCLLGTVDPADVVSQVGIEDQNGLGIWDQSLMGIEGPGVLSDAGLAVADAQSQGRPDSQVAFGSRVRRCGCWSGGLGCRGRLVGAPQLQPHYPENNVYNVLKQGALYVQKKRKKGK